VLGKWGSIEELLAEPDIDCTCVAFDGKTVWANQRGRLSFNFRRITTSSRGSRCRGSPQYEKRLVKYSRRGFFISVQNFSWDKVSNLYMEIGYKRVKSRILPLQRVYGLRLLLVGFMHPDCQPNNPVFDLPGFPENEGIPYGPKWDAPALRKQLLEKRIENTQYGPTELESPYQIMQDFGREINTISLFIEPFRMNDEDDDYIEPWDSLVWKKQEQEADQYRRDDRLEYGDFYYRPTERTYVKLKNIKKFHIARGRGGRGRGARVVGQDLTRSYEFKVTWKDGNPVDDFAQDILVAEANPHNNKILLKALQDNNIPIVPDPKFLYRV